MQRTSGLNIELLRTPLKSVKPTVLTDRPSKKTALILPGSEAESIAISQSRIEILRESFLHFPKHMAELRMRLQRCLDEGVQPVDAMYTAVEAALETCIMTAPESAAMTNAEVLFQATRHSDEDVKEAKSAREAVTLLARHGFRVLIGLLEIAPAVYEKTYKEPPGEATLQNLIPASIEPLMSVVSRGPGGYALIIERVLGMKGHRFVAEGNTCNRLAFEPEFLEIKVRDGQPIVDMTNGIAETIIEYVKDGHMKYYGCLAGHVNMPEAADQESCAAKTPTLFTFMTQLTSSLMREHWFPRLLKKT